MKSDYKITRDKFMDDKERWQKFILNLKNVVNSANII